jgi:hypothetical protein
MMLLSAFTNVVLGRAISSKFKGKILNKNVTLRFKLISKFSQFDIKVFVISLVSFRDNFKIKMRPTAGN